MTYIPNPETPRVGEVWEFPNGTCREIRADEPGHPMGHQVQHRLVHTETFLIARWSIKEWRDRAKNAKCIKLAPDAKDGADE